MQVQAMIAPRDVPAIGRLYQRLLDARSAHRGDEYGRSVRDGELLQLHHHDHGDVG